MAQGANLASRATKPTFLAACLRSISWVRRGAGVWIPNRRVRPGGGSPDRTTIMDEADIPDATTRLRSDVA